MSPHTSLCSRDSRFWADVLTPCVIISWLQGLLVYTTGASLRRSVIIDVGRPRRISAVMTGRDFSIYQKTVYSMMVMRPVREVIVIIAWEGGEDIDHIYYLSFSFYGTLFMPAQKHPCTRPSGSSSGTLNKALTQFVDWLSGFRCFLTSAQPARHNRHTL